MLELEEQDDDERQESDDDEREEHDDDEQDESDDDEREEPDDDKREQSNDGEDGASDNENKEGLTEDADGESDDEVRVHALLLFKVLFDIAERDRLIEPRGERDDNFLLSRVVGRPRAVQLERFSFFSTCFKAAELITEA